MSLTESHWPIDTSEPLLERTIGDLLREAADGVPERVALVDGVVDVGARRSWTYAELLAEAERVAHALLRRFAPGDRVAVWAPNAAEWVLLLHGAALAGVVLVTINPANRESEVLYVLGQSRAKGLFHGRRWMGQDMAETVARVRSSAPDLLQAFVLDEIGELDRGVPPSGDLPVVDPSGPTQVQYTSGTTGTPKGALLHHRGAVNSARFVARRAGMEDGAVCINAMPMFHIGGSGVTALGTLAHRGTFVVLPLFAPALVLEAIETFGGTTTLAVPTMLSALLDHPDRTRRDLRTLRTVMSGASAVPAALVERTRDELDCAFTIIYGQTEMHGVVCQTLMDDDAADQSETLGRALPQVEIRIADRETGATTPLGVGGEICVRGYQTMLRYFDAPDATAGAVDEDGWLRSGDVGTMDERGYLRITGRISDMIIRGGENVYPREIEDALREHPGIADLAVVGIADPQWGELVAAVVRPVDPGAPPDLGDVATFARAALARFKVPTLWFEVGEFPLTASGKIRKFVLQEQILAGELSPRSAPSGWAPPTPV